MLCLSTIQHLFNDETSWMGREICQEQHHRSSFSMFIQSVRACLLHHHQSPPACLASVCDERIIEISFLLVVCWLNLFFSLAFTTYQQRRTMRTIDKQVLLNQIIYYTDFSWLSPVYISISLCLSLRVSLVLFLFIIDIVGISIVVFRIRKRRGQNDDWRQTFDVITF